jgi:hypothetical protein
MLLVIVLRRPHLVLAHVGHQNGVASGHAPDVVDDVRCVQVSAVGQVLDVAHRHLSLAGLDGLDPCRTVAAPMTTTDAGKQQLEDFAQIAHQRDIDIHILVDLRWINLDVNLLGLGGIRREGSCNAVIEPHAAGDQQVGLLNGLIHPRLAVHAHHAQVELVRGREGPQPQQRQRHGNLCALRQRVHLLLGAGFDDAVPGQNHRPLGVANQLGSLRQPVFFHIQHGVRPMGTRLCGGKVKLRRALLRVLGNIHQHRPRASGLRNLKGVADRRGNVFGAVDEEVMFCHRQCDAGNVHFLKRIAAQQFAGNVAGDADNGNRVQHSRGNAGD